MTHTILRALALTTVVVSGCAAGCASESPPANLPSDGGVDATVVGDFAMAPLDPNDPLNAAPVCTSGSFYNLDAGDGPHMHPGRDCNACHRGNPRTLVFMAAGTVFPTGHEPDDCYGAVGAAANVAEATVVFTDANGKVAEAVNVIIPGGNFILSAPELAVPYTAKVVYRGKERVMRTPQTSGDCNGCHTQSGTTLEKGQPPAPGRITLPE